MWLFTASAFKEIKLINVFNIFWSLWQHKIHKINTNYIEQFTCFSWQGASPTIGVYCFQSKFFSVLHDYTWLIKKKKKKGNRIKVIQSSLIASLCVYLFSYLFMGFGTNYQNCITGFCFFFTFKTFFSEMKWKTSFDLSSAGSSLLQE